MRFAVILVLYKTAADELERVTGQFGRILPGCQFFVHDNSVENHGYAYGVNSGIRKAAEWDADAVIIANTDIDISRLKEEDIMEGLERFDVLGFSFRQGNNIYYGGEIDKINLSGGLLQDKPSKRYQKVDFISGSFMVVKKYVIRSVGMFDEDYFMYYEDVDYCRRAAIKGFAVGIDAEVCYTHFERSSDGLHKRPMLDLAHGIFVNKWGKWNQRMRYKIKKALPNL